MAPSAYDVVRPALFPVRNIVDMASKDLKQGVVKQEAKPIAAPIDHVTSFFATLPRVLITGLCWYVMFPISEARTFQAGWVAHVFIRDLVITFGLAGPWEFLLYSDASPFKINLGARKFNPVYPKASMIRFCMFWTLISTLVSSAMEVAYLHLLATHAIEWEPTLFSFSTLVWLLLMNYIRLGHFYFVHRLIHPWKTTAIPDLGEILYKHVHSLHHKSFNPTAFSGISMHPVESFLYYTVMAVPVLFGCHPVIPILYKHDATLGALWGHDGFADPGSGSYPHFLHHAHFEVNYGENLVPFDYWFGSFHPGGPLKAKK